MDKNFVDFVPLGRDIYQMKQNGELCDVVLYHENNPTGKIHAHRLALARASDYFKEKFTSANRQGESYVVKIEGPQVDPTSLNLIIDYMYTGHLEVNDANCRDFLLLAQLLRLPRAELICVQFMEQNFSAEKALETLRFAQFHGINQLGDLANNFVLQNFGQVCEKKQEFMKLTAEQMIPLVSSDDLDAPEELVLQTVIDWLNFQPETRDVYAAEMLHCVRFNLLPREKLATLKSDSNLLKWFHVCRDAIFDALCLVCEGRSFNNSRAFQRRQSGGSSTSPNVNNS